MAKRHLTARIPHIYKTTPQTDWKHALSPALTHPCRCKFQPGPNVNLPQRSCGTRAIGKGYMRRPQLGLAFQRCFRVLGPYSGITTWPGSNARIWPKNSKTTLKSQTQLRSSHVAFPYGTRATRALRKIHIWSWLKFATAWMG